MPYTLIKGSFHIYYPERPLTGPEPDGDTLKFLPDNRSLILNLPRPNQAAAFNQAGITSIRFEAIDALETHFDVEGERFHQKMDLALAERDALLAQMGFGQVRFFADHPFKVESVEHHPVRGYILSNGLDTYGRTIAFVFSGESTMADGSRVFVTPEMLEQSLNAFMLRSGQAYPAFYSTLPADLREHMREIAKVAHTAGIGLWPQATADTRKEAEIGGLAQLQELVIWPKLFRRLAAYFQEGHSDLTALDNWLRQDPRNRDDRILLSNLELGNMHDLIIENGRRIKLAYEPEDVVIVPDDFVLPTGPVVNPAPRPGTGDIRIVAALVDPIQRPERGHESVTLINTSTREIDLGGWFVADAHGKQALDGVLPAGDTLRVALGNAVQLNNTRDTISVLGPDGSIIDQVSYQARELPPEGHTKTF